MRQIRQITTKFEELDMAEMKQLVAYATKDTFYGAAIPAEVSLEARRILKERGYRFIGNRVEQRDTGTQAVDIKADRLQTIHGVLRRRRRESAEIGGLDVDEDDVLSGTRVSGGREAEGDEDEQPHSEARAGADETFEGEDKLTEVGEAMEDKDLMETKEGTAAESDIAGMDGAGSGGETAEKMRVEAAPTQKRSKRKPCTVDGCGSLAVKDGICHHHYTERHGVKPYSKADNEKKSEPNPAAISSVSKAKRHSGTGAVAAVMDMQVHSIILVEEDRRFTVTDGVRKAEIVFGRVHDGEGKMDFKRCDLDLGLKEGETAGVYDWQFVGAVATHVEMLALEIIGK